MSPALPRVAIVTGAARGIGAAGSPSGSAATSPCCGRARPRRDRARTRSPRSGPRVPTARWSASTCPTRDSVAAAVVPSRRGPRCADRARQQRRHHPRQPALQDEHDDWDSRMAASTWRLPHDLAAQAHMTQAGWGRIVNLSSSSALGNRGQANYAAAKAGMQGLRRRPWPSSSRRFGVRHGQRHRTRLHRHRDDPCDGGAAGVSRVPGRAGAKEDAGAPVGTSRTSRMPSFFVSDGASFVTGQVLYVAGGPRLIR